MKVTEAARTKIIDVMIDEQTRYLRFGLQGGGCNGFTYVFNVEQEKNEDDVEFVVSDAHSILIDPISYIYVEDTEIDYVKKLMDEHFVFNNPKQTASCGCGHSVSF